MPHLQPPQQPQPQQQQQCQPSAPLTLQPCWAQEYDEVSILERQDATSFQLLLNAGVHPGLAACLAEPAQDAAGVRQLLLGWALLLAHLQQQESSARGRAWLTESLTEVEGYGLNTYFKLVIKSHAEEWL